MHFDLKAAPVHLDQSSIVFDVQKFVERELADLDSRINDPWTVRGGWTIFQILNRLAQCGVVIEVDVSLFPPKEPE